MQSSNRGVRAANRVDAADDEGRPTGGEVYNRPGGGGAKAHLEKSVKKVCSANSWSRYKLYSDYRRPMVSIR
jgi:hypothetical protein